VYQLTLLGKFRTDKAEMVDILSFDILSVRQLELMYYQPPERNDWHGNARSGGMYDERETRWPKRREECSVAVSHD
jgi:hypothetical protein